MKTKLLVKVLLGFILCVLFLAFINITLLAATYMPIWAALPLFAFVVYIMWKELK
nr:MAG TPA: hypothetical protein [Caudoviricetes sp.]